MFIRTPRLMLRPGWPEDAPELARAIGQWDVVRNLGRAPWPYALSDAEQFLAEQSATRAGASFLICAREGDDAPIIGGIGFGPYEDRACEIGYWLTPPMWGRGYASEAGGALLALAASLGIVEITGGHYVDNPASGAVLRKLGFVATGSADRRCRARDAMVPCAEYGLMLRPAGEPPELGAGARAA